MENLHALSDDALLCNLESVLGSQRQLLARLLAYLAEVEQRRLHLKAAYSSLFAFCTERLRMSEDEACRRIGAARLARRFPVIFELVESGAVHSSALGELADYLTEDNHQELLREASGKTKRQVQALLAARFPKPDVAPSIRKLPEQTAMVPPPSAPAGNQPASRSNSPAPARVTTHLEPLCPR